MPTMMQKVKIVRNNRDWKQWAPFNIFNKEWTLVNWMTNKYGNWCALVYYIFNEPPKIVYWMWIECRQLKFISHYSGKLPAPQLQLALHDNETYLNYQRKNVKLFNGDWIARYMKSIKKQAVRQAPSTSNKNKNKKDNVNKNKKENMNNTAV